MTAVLYSSRPSGSKKLTLDGIQFGWGTIEKIFTQENHKCCKTKHARNFCQQRSRAVKQEMKLHKKRPSYQDISQRQLIQAIESSDARKKELCKIVQEGNKFEGKGGLEAGDCLGELWRKDKEEFFKDQQSNGKNLLL